MEDIDFNDVLLSINKCIKWKSSDRKSYVRTKIRAKQVGDDYTQLCYEYHKLLLEKKMLEQIIIKINIKEIVKEEIEDDEIYE